MDKFFKNFKKTFSQLRKIYPDNTLPEIANTIDVKVEKIHHYLTGTYFPNLDFLEKASSFFRVSIDYLVLGEKNKYLNFISLFTLAEITNELKSMPRNHIEDSVSQFVDSAMDKPSLFDEKRVHSLTNSLNKNIKILRTEKKITQNQLAKLLNLATNVSIYNYERSAEPPLEKIIKLSEIFKISIHYLITGKPLAFGIKDNIFSEKLLLFDNNVSIEEINVIVKMMNKILENNKLGTIDSMPA